MSDRLLADLVMIVHLLFVLFVVGGFVLVLIGGWRDWRWVRNPWFRYAHLLAIGVVVAQAWLGVLCPLTLLEMALRTEAEGEAYHSGFIAYWVGTILYYEAPAWVFTVIYTLFGAAVVASWAWIRPASFSRHGR